MIRARSHSGIRVNAVKLDIVVKLCTQMWCFLFPFLLRLPLSPCTTTNIKKKLCKASTKISGYIMNYKSSTPIRVREPCISAYQCLCRNRSVLPLFLSLSLCLGKFVSLLLSEIVGIDEAEHLLALHVKSIARALMLKHVILQLLHLPGARVHLRLVVEHAILLRCLV